MSKLGRVVVLALLGLVLGGAGVAHASVTPVVVSQVYGGGGNSGATYKNDFIELHNQTANPVSLTGWSVQYASASGVTWLTTPLVGNVPAGGYYLVQEAQGVGGTTDLPTPDAIGSIAMAASTGGKVALVQSTDPLSGSCPAADDLVGYGTADCFEGTGAAPAPSNTNSDIRGASGCMDTNDNSADFTATAAAPRNSASPLQFCFPDDAPTVSSTTPTDTATDVAVDANVDITFSEPVDVTAGWYGISCDTSGDHTAEVGGGGTSFTLNPDSDFANGENCTVTITAADVSDQDLNDPPDTMASDYVFSFSTVAAAVPTQYLVTSSDYSPTVGTSVTISAQLADSDGNPVAAAGHTVDWSMTACAGGGLSADTSSTDSSGVATVNLTVPTAAFSNCWVTATDEADNSITGTNDTTIVPVPGPANHLNVTSSSADLTSGDTRDLTAEVRDVYGNVVIADDSTVTFSQTDGTGSVTGLGDAQAVNGIATKTVTGVAAGPVTITASADGLGTAPTSFTVVHGAPDHLKLIASIDDLTAGTDRSLEADVVDAHDNLVTSDNRQISFNQTGGFGSATGVGVANASSGIATESVTGRRGGSVTMQASALGLFASNPLTFTVVPGALDRLQLLVAGETAVPGTADGKCCDPTPQTAGASFDVTVNGTDSQWNPVPTAADTIQLLASDGHVVLPANAPLTAGTHTFSVTAKKAGTLTLSALDVNNGSITSLNGNSTLTVNPGPFAKLQLLAPGQTADPGTPTGRTGAPTARTAGAAFPVTVNAVDANWNKISTVTDTVHLASSDTHAVLPANAALVAGTKSLPVIFKTAGSSTLTASDVTAPAKTASTSPAITVNPGAFTRLQLLVPGEKAAPGSANGKTGTPTARTAGAQFAVTVNAVDAFWNKVASTDTVHLTSTDTKAALPANAALVAGTRSLSVALKTAGSRTITASDVTNQAKTPSASPPIVVKPGVPHVLAFTSPTTSLKLGTLRKLIVEVRDAYGNKVATDSGRTVTFAKTAGVGTVAGLGTATTSTGRAAKTVKATGAGLITIRASATGLLSGTTTFGITP